MKLFHNDFLYWRIVVIFVMQVQTLEAQIRLSNSGSEKTNRSDRISNTAYSGQDWSLQHGLEFWAADLGFFWTDADGLSLHFRSLETRQNSSLGLR